MKWNKWSVSLSVLALTGLLALSGCHTAPTPVESHLFDVTTNSTPVVTQTPTGPVTNQATSYTFTPNATVQAGETIAGEVGNFFGVGGAVTTALSLIFGLWAHVRSSQSTASVQALTQIIQTGRQLLQQLPNGAALDNQFVHFMIQHQAETGTISQIALVVKSATNNQAAIGAASEIMDIINAASAATTPPTPPIAPAAKT